MQKVEVLLLDASGSMLPAWYDAFQELYKKLENTYHAIVLLAFKHVHHVGSLPVVTRGKYAAIINVAELLRRQGNVIKIKRAPAPEEVGMVFSGYTPLNESLILVMRIISQRFGAPAVIHVFTDNRDSMMAKDPEYAQLFNDEEVIRAKRETGSRLVAHLVGDYNLKYTVKYDEVVVSKRPELLDLI